MAPLTLILNSILFCYTTTELILFFITNQPLWAGSKRTQHRSASLWTDQVSNELQIDLKSESSKIERNNKYQIIATIERFANNMTIDQLCQQR